jgi:uncharacterized repeat protein (TIGR03803 family)
MNQSSARSTIAKTFVFLFVLVAAARAQTYSVLTSFDNTNGSYVFATPLIDSLGNVFGTTESGGSPDNCGVVYELVNNGGGSYTNTTLYNFTCGDDGGAPKGGVVMDSAGNLYGTTQYGGAYAYGVVYELVNHGGSYTLEVIHAFSDGKGGGYPLGDLVRFKGSLYGVTSIGGGGGCYGGCGTVYRLTKSGDKWVETVLHVFNYDQGDGTIPSAEVALDSGGNIYGTTSGGGSFGNGTVFKLSPQGGPLDAPESSGSYKETILHSFEGKADGCYIFSGVVLDSAGNLYGTASDCGKDSKGTVYQLMRSGSKYGFRVILTFNGTNGAYPTDEPGHLALDSAGNVYGTAYGGGAYGYGTVFKLAAGSFLYTDLHDFNYNGTEGIYPSGGVSLDSLGNLYGTTYLGGSNAYGAVWQIANP